MFQLSKDEFDSWRSHLVIFNPGAKMGLRYPPYGFTEHGVALLSSIVHSRRNKHRFCQILATNQELAGKVAQHDRQIVVLLERVQKMLAPLQ
jgi:ORF6N domain-containing protein